jgi:hypothetical protein
VREAGTINRPGLLMKVTMTTQDFLDIPNRLLQDLKTHPDFAVMEFYDESQSFRRVKFTFLPEQVDKAFSGSLLVQLQGEDATVGSDLIGVITLQVAQLQIDSDGGLHPMNVRYDWYVQFPNWIDELYRQITRNLFGCAYSQLTSEFHWGRSPFCDRCPEQIQCLVKKPTVPSF